MILVTVIKITIVACTFVGNLFVIIAILIDKNLQTPANQLVLSLAVADLMVGCLVMPLGTYNDFHDGWWLGKEVCEFWTSADVLCCTASILNLLAIALDRYWAVTNVDYIYKRTRKRVSLMIVCAWLVGAIVSLAPIFGWKDPDFARRVLEDHKCLVSQDVAYQIFATISTFYAPLVLLLALYWRIFKVARKRIHCRPGGKLNAGTEAQKHHHGHHNHNQPHQQQHQRRRPSSMAATASTPLDVATVVVAVETLSGELIAGGGPSLCFGGEQKSSDAPPPPPASLSVVALAASLETDQKSIAQRGVLAARETGATETAPSEREAKNVSPSGRMDNSKPFGDSDGDNDGRRHDERQSKPSAAVNPTVAGAAITLAATQDGAKLTTLTVNDIFTGVAGDKLAPTAAAASRDGAEAGTRRLKDRCALAVARGMNGEWRRAESGAVEMNEKQICLRPSQTTTTAASNDDGQTRNSALAADNNRAPRQSRRPSDCSAHKDHHQPGGVQAPCAPRDAPSGCGRPGSAVTGAASASLAAGAPSGRTQTIKAGACVGADDVLKLLRCAPQASAVVRLDRAGGSPARFDERSALTAAARRQSSQRLVECPNDGQHHQLGGAMAAATTASYELAKRPSLVQLDARLLSNSSANSNNIDEASPTNSLSDCHCCCCAHAAGHTSDEEEEGLEEGHDDECDVDDNERRRGDNQSWRPGSAQAAAANARPWRDNQRAMTAGECAGIRASHATTMRAQFIGWESDKILLRRPSTGLAGCAGECACGQRPAASQLILDREALRNGCASGPARFQPRPRDGRLSQRSSFSSASSLVSSVSSSSRSMLAAAAAADVEHPDGQMIEQLQLDEGGRPSCQQQATTDEGRPLGEGRLAQRPAEPIMIRPPMFGAAQRPTTGPATTTNTTTEISDRPALANQSSAKKVPALADESLAQAAPGPTGNSDNNFNNHCAAFQQCCQVAAETAGAISGSRLEGGGDRGGSQRPDAANRDRFSLEAAAAGEHRLTTGGTSGLRRRFRTLGQLVSFVQTSRQFNSSSSAHTSQSGDEAAANADENGEDDDGEAFESERASGCQAETPAGAAEGPLEDGARLLARQLPRTSEAVAAAMCGAKQTAKTSVTVAAMELGEAVGVAGPITPGHELAAHHRANRNGLTTDKLTAGAAAPTTDRDNQLKTKQSSQLGISLVSRATTATMAQAAVAALKITPQSRQQGGGAAAGGRRELSAAQQRRQNLEMKREKKAAKTLAIITGVFVCCWLPFFLNAIVMPICGQTCTPSDLILSVLLWLGYLNSLLNPIIYTIFSPDFRRAFHRLLCWPESSSSSSSKSSKSNHIKARRSQQQRLGAAVKYGHHNNHHRLNSSGNCSVPSR